MATLSDPLVEVIITRHDLCPDLLLFRIDAVGSSVGAETKHLLALAHERTEVAHVLRLEPLGLHLG